jgi:hypothetical protein
VTIIPPPVASAPPHTVIGFPPATGGVRILSTPGALRSSGALSFSGEGHEIWQNPAVGTPAAGFHRGFPISPIYPRRPIYPISPIFPVWGYPIFGGGFWPGFGFGGLGLGWGLGWNSWGCGAYGGWGFGCDAFPYYDSGYGNYGYAYSPGGLEGQIESQNGPAIYENAPAPAPLVYGGGERQLVQLYMKDGSEYDVTDYWLVDDNELHFTTVDANGNQTEHVIGFDQLDLRKTIDVNTDRGYRFVLRNEPIQQYLQGTESNAPEGTAPEGPLQPPAPQVPAVPPQPAAPAQPAQPH